jgi:hypothetical protein
MHNSNGYVFPCRISSFLPKEEGSKQERKKERKKELVPLTFTIVLSLLV